MKTRMLIVDIDDCGYPKISTAPAWNTEDRRLYACQTSDGGIVLQTNPASWEWVDYGKGRWARKRPKPIPLDQAPGKLAPMPAELVEVKARAAGDRLLDQALGGF